MRWPSGAVQTWSDVAADRILDIREGDDQVEGQKHDRTRQGADRTDPE